MQTYISVLTSFVQIVVVARAFKLLGLGGSLLFLPLFAFAGYGLAGVLPLLGLVATVKVVENATDYSLQNTTQQALFLSTSRDAKYKAKAAIDTLFVRLGDAGVDWSGLRGDAGRADHYRLRSDQRRGQRRMDLAGVPAASAHFANSEPSDHGRSRAQPRD